MEIVVVIDDQMLEEPVKKAVANAVNSVVREVANRKVLALTRRIEAEVDVFLSKKITLDDQIENMIHNEVKQQLADRIRDLVE